jgi:molecular chaperone GrpE
MKDDSNKNKEEEQQEEVNEEEIGELDEVANETEEAQLLQSQIEAWEAKYKRALADYHNLQKRVNEERLQWIGQANKDLLLRILPILDTLMLAEKHNKDQGIMVSIQQFLDILKAEGVIRVKTVGEAFDPQSMECVTTGEGKEDIIIEEIRAGYLLNDKVLRAAQVIVGKGKN